MFFISLSETPSFDIKILTSFLLGILAGFTLFFVVILLLASRSKKQSVKIYGPTNKDLDKEKVRELILNKQEVFINEVEENDKDYLKTVMSLITELIHEISSYYYPESKYPEYELTITEAANLIHYVVNQITEIFDKPVLKNLKNVRISFIASSIDKTKRIANNKAVKAAKDSSEALEVGNTIINTLNPIYWIRKIAIKGTLNMAIKKVCKAGISIVGKEANNIYSKKIFNDEEEIKETKKDIEEIFNDED